MTLQALDKRICISIGESSQARLLLIDSPLSAAAAGLIEIRGDLCRIEDSLLEALLLKYPNIIFTYRSCAENEDTALRQMLLAVRCGAAYIDIDACAPEQHLQAVKEAISTSGSATGLIVSRHFPGQMPSCEELEVSFNQCLSLGADIVKIAATANDTAEASRILRLYTPGRKGRLLAFAMGEAGQFTRSVILSLGAPFTYCSAGVATAPGQYSAAQIQALLDERHYGFAVPRASQCGLIREMHEQGSATRSLPCSKSIAQRAIVAAAIVRGKSILRGYTECDDTLSAIAFAKACGCTVKEGAPGLEITSPGIDCWELPSRIECGESGILARLLMPLLAYLSSRNHQTYTLLGKGTLNGRDMKDTFDNLRAAGVKCSPQYRCGGEFLPADICAGEDFGSYADLTLSGRGGSQIVSGMLMMLPLLRKDIRLNVILAVSTPYIRLTIETIRHFGIRVETCKNVSQTSGNVSFIIPSGQSYTSAEMDIEPDWSSAAPLIAAAALASREGGEAEGAKLYLEGLRTGTSQADEALMQVAGTKEPFTFDATDCPDLFPILATLAVFRHGQSRIRGVGRLRSKESNRAESIVGEWSRLGFRLYIEDDTLIIDGDGGFHPHAMGGGAVLCSCHNDHRIAMALIVTAMFSPLEVRLDDIGCISKSFPNYVTTLGIRQ